MKTMMLLTVLCIFAALLAGCIGNDSVKTTSPDVTRPTITGTVPSGNTAMPQENVNKTPGEESRAPPEGMNITPGEPIQPPDGGMGAHGEQSRQPDGLNGTPPAPGNTYSGMQPPSPPGM